MFFKHQGPVFIDTDQIPEGGASHYSQTSIIPLRAMPPLTSPSVLPGAQELWKKEDPLQGLLHSDQRDIEGDPFSEIGLAGA